MMTRAAKLPAFAYLDTDTMAQALQHVAEGGPSPAGHILEMLEARARRAREAVRALAACGLPASVCDGCDIIEAPGFEDTLRVPNGNLIVTLAGSYDGYIRADVVAAHPQQDVSRMMDAVNAHVNLGAPLGSLADAAECASDVMPLARWSMETHLVVSSRAHRERVRVSLLSMRRAGLPWPVTEDVLVRMTER